MNSLIMAFLVTIGVLSVSEDKVAGRVEPAVSETRITAEAELRRERIRLTNDWLRSLRQVARPDNTAGPVTVAQID